MLKSDRGEFRKKRFVRQDKHLDSAHSLHDPTVPVKTTVPHIETCAIEEGNEAVRQTPCDGIDLFIVRYYCFTCQAVR